MTRYALPQARIEWQGGNPYNLDVGDIYFSRDGGLDEARQTFLQGNDLPDRWRGCRQFVIAETGFGTGLNLLATLAAWQEHAPTDAVLYYHSIEACPLSREDLARAMAAWPTLAALAAEVAAVYPPPVPGFHRRLLRGGCVHMTFLWGDALAMLGELRGVVDAWYLDGFAPRKNGAMWSEDLFREIARCSRVGTTFGTYTVAGAVRRGLQAAGFRIAKAPGFGTKREMLRGRLEQPAASTMSEPWFALPRAAPLRAAVAVVGGGIAGVTTAAALAARGFQVTLIERRERLADEASGNPAGIVVPHLAADMNDAAMFSLSAFLHTTAWLDGLVRAGIDCGWQRSGVLQLLDEGATVRLAALGLPQNVAEPVDASRASQLAGWPVSRGGVYFPTAGWLEPRRLCRALQQCTPAMSLRLDCSVDRLVRDGERWQLIGADSVVATADAVVLANAVEARRLLPDHELPITRVRGQLTYLSSEQVQGALPTRPVCGDGYAIPLSSESLIVGATFDRALDDTALSPEHHRRNLDTLAALTGSGRALDRDPATLAGRVSFRAATRDYRPLVGAVPDLSFFQQRYADLHHGRPAAAYSPARHLPGLFLNVGHGSRGLVSAPLAAELIADVLAGVPASLPNALLRTLNPARFVVQKLRRSPASDGSEVP